MRDKLLTHSLSFLFMSVLAQESWLGSLKAAAMSINYSFDDLKEQVSDLGEQAYGVYDDYQQKLQEE